MFPKIILLTVLIAVLGACAAPTEIPASTVTVLAVTATHTSSPVATETPIPTPTSTPEPTATPEPVPSEPTEITFNLTNGETLSMPGFIANIPANATPEEIVEIEKRLVEKAFELIVTDGVRWGDAWAIRTDQATKAEIDFYNKKNKILNIVFRGATMVPWYLGIEQNNQFYIGCAGAPYNQIDGTVFEYKSDDGGMKAVFVAVNVDKVFSLIRNNLITIPPKPTQITSTP